VIRVERHEETSPGRWRWTVPAFGLAGSSNTPLIDACRKIVRARGPLQESAAIFRARGSEPDLTVGSVESGAKLTVRSTGGFDYRGDDADDRAEAAE
jgi:hypothetical protein